MKNSTTLSTRTCSCSKIKLMRNNKAYKKKYGSFKFKRNQAKPQSKWWTSISKNFMAGQDNSRKKSFNWSWKDKSNKKKYKSKKQPKISWTSKDRSTPREKNYQPRRPNKRMPRTFTTWRLFWSKLKRMKKKASKKYRNWSPPTRNFKRKYPTWTTN